MVKVVSLFLIGMLVLAMFGRLRMPNLPKMKQRRSIEGAGKCSKCGAYKIGNKPCMCDKK